MLGEKGMWGKEGMLLIRAGILAAGRVSRACAGARDAVWFLKRTQLLLARRVANSVISLFILPARQKKKICVFCRDLGSLRGTRGCWLAGVCKDAAFPGKPDVFGQGLTLR